MALSFKKEGRAAELIESHFLQVFFMAFFRGSYPFFKGCFFFGFRGVLSFFKASFWFTIFLRPFLGVSYPFLKAIFRGVLSFFKGLF